MNKWHFEESRIYDGFSGLFDENDNSVFALAHKNDGDDGAAWIEGLLPEHRAVIEEAPVMAAKLAALRAENARLREALWDALRHLKHFIKNHEYIAIQNSEAALNSTTPDPLYTAAPEMLEALKLVVKEGIPHTEFCPACMNAIEKATNVTTTTAETYKKPTANFTLDDRP